MLFCNIGWMNRYEGDKGKPDRIVGGGEYVVEHGTGNEVCNFVACEMGYVYGHVETIHGKRDQQIRVERIGGNETSANGVDVVWTATDPDNHGRRVVGWYRNATVFRERQEFGHPPPRQHKRDGIDSYRICARADDVHRLGLEDRMLVMPRGRGWMGHRPWWFPPDPAPPEVQAFLDQVEALLDAQPNAEPMVPNRHDAAGNTPGAAAEPYIRYVNSHETEISPRHQELQRRFERFLRVNGATQLRPNVESVDLRYRDATRRAVFVEVKPCEAESARYATRTAMGQLLDYRQRAAADVSLLVVLETVPNEEDRELATTNGFGIAYPDQDGFVVVWPS